MKRVFISLLVLAITSTVNATPQILVDGDKNYNFLDNSNPSGNYTLGIFTDALMQGGEGINLALVVDTSHGTIDYTSGFVVPPYDTDPGFLLEHGTSAADLGFPLPAGEDGICGVIWPMNFSSIAPDATIFDGIDFRHSSYHGLVAINLYMSTNLETSYLIDTQWVFTPEPMTIGLLGLGVLFMRKRKA